MSDQKSAGVPWPWDDAGNWSPDWISYLNAEQERKKTTGLILTQQSIQGYTYVTVLATGHKEAE